MVTDFLTSLSHLLLLLKLQITIQARGSAEDQLAHAYLLYILCYPIGWPDRVSSDSSGSPHLNSCELPRFYLYWTNVYLRQELLEGNPAWVLLKLRHWVSLQQRCWSLHTTILRLCCAAQDSSCVRRRPPCCSLDIISRRTSHRPLP